MKTRLTRLVFCGALIWAAAAGGVQGGGAARVTASPAAGTTLSIYDDGTALVQERRHVTLSGGDAVVVLGEIPAHIDPGSVSFTSEGEPGMELIETHFHDFPEDASGMLRRYLGGDVRVLGPAGEVAGVLKGVPDDMSAERWRPPLTLADAAGGLHVFMDAGDVEEIVLPGATGKLSLRPELEWRVKALAEGPLSFRLNYRVHGLTWRAAYGLVLGEGGRSGSLVGRVLLHNGCGGRMNAGRVRLVTTEAGQARRLRLKEEDVSAPRAAPVVLRYAYGTEKPTFESRVTGPAPLGVLELPREVTLADGEEVVMRFVDAAGLPVRRFYVYDGVKFDRFQRNRRNDWDYGTESREVVESYIEFDNSPRNGLGRLLLPGTIRVYRRYADGAQELLGEDMLPLVPTGAVVHVRMGPARGLRGKRERLGYSEVVPFHEYEESFEIRLENNTSEEVEIRVVEHMYRWHVFDIVKADTEYVRTGARTIEFHPRIGAGGRRSIHYTVRYRW